MTDRAWSKRQLRALLIRARRLRPKQGSTPPACAPSSSHRRLAPSGDSQAGRWLKFTSVKEVQGLESVLRNFLGEAMELEKSGKKVELKKPSEYPVPEELQTLLNKDKTLKMSFDALTPGRRKSYIFHISNAKQAKTRAVRAEKCIPMIRSGRGFNEMPG